MRQFASAWLLSSVCIVNLSGLPSTPISIGFFVFIVLFALKVRLFRPWVAGFLFAILTLSIGFLQLASHQLKQDQISKDLTLTVQIHSVPERHSGRLSFVAKVRSCLDCEDTLHVGKVRLSWYGQVPHVFAGELWQLKVRLKPPSSQRNAGSFDAVAWHWVKGLHARGYVRDSASSIRLAKSTHSTLASVRQKAQNRLQSLPGEDEYIGLVLGLAVGIKAYLSEAQWELLRSTGTAHLLAISGLHVGLVAAWALVFCRTLFRVMLSLGRVAGYGFYAFDSRAICLVFSLACAVAYAALAGFELPTQRAVIMLSVWVVAAIRFRFLPPFAALCLAMIAVFFVNALNILSVGFWLSFGTVAILFFLHKGHVQPSDAEYDQVKQTAMRRIVSRFAYKLLSMARTHVLLGIALVPITAWFFQSGSLVAPLANLVAVPWVAMLSVPLALATLVVSVFSHSLATYLLAATQASLQALMRFLELLQNSMISDVALTIPGPFALCLVLIAILFLLAPRAIGVRMFAIPLLLPAALHNVGWHANDTFEVHMLDVGQGLAVLVFAGEHTLLFDTGGKVSPSLSMFDAVVVPFLKSSGRRKIDTLVISHGDEDHSFGAADAVRQYSGVTVYSSASLDLPAESKQTLCAAGQHWQFEDVNFAFIHPTLTDPGSDNNRSCVLLVYKGNTRVLLTGDIEADAEDALISRAQGGPFAPITLMSAPHHGSRTSSTQAFIDLLQPKHVVFAAGQRNRYGFPHIEVQLRYKMGGAILHNTASQGAISFELGSDGLIRQPSSWWTTNRRFWHGIANPDCWQNVASQSFILKQLALSQKGQTLCGK